MSSVIELTLKIMQDLKEPIQYLPCCLLLGFPFVLLIRILYFILHKKITHKKVFLCFLMSTYLTVLLFQAFFSRQAGSRSGIELYPFSILGVSVGEDASFMENILMFLPFGFLMPFIWRLMRSPFYCIGVAFIGSVSLEIMQLVTGRGYCQIDDIISNTAGAVLGYMLTSICFLHHKRIHQKVYPVKSLSEYQLSR